MLHLDSPEMMLIVDVLRESAAMARRIQQDMMMMDMTKSDLSPVTVADFAIQALVARRLRSRFPDAVLVGEENADRLREPENAAMLETIVTYVKDALPEADSDSVCAWIDAGTEDYSDCFWTLDPIDGTKGYRRGDQYAVALALLEKGRVIRGGLACPGLDATCMPVSGGCGALAVAERDRGAWVAPLNAPDAPAMRMRVSECTSSSRGRLLRSFESGHTNVAETEAIAAQLGIPESNMVRMDSQAKYAALAAGNAEFLFRLLSPTRPDYRECIWDHAAGAIILEEAGGKVTDLNGLPFDFTKGRKLTANIGLFASNGPLHNRGLEAIRATSIVPDGTQ